MKHSAATLYQKEGTKKVLASLISILMGLLVGGDRRHSGGPASIRRSRPLRRMGRHPHRLRRHLQHRPQCRRCADLGLQLPSTRGNMLFRATPLIMTGLSVAVAFKTGLFNIGAPGQYLICHHGDADDRPEHPHLPPSPPGSSGSWPFWAACLAGALWGALPGLAKACLNINEVLACIMTNWVAANLVTWMFDMQQLQEHRGEHQVRLHL